MSKRKPYKGPRTNRCFVCQRFVGLNYWRVPERPAKIYCEPCAPDDAADVWGERKQQQRKDDR